MRSHFLERATPLMMSPASIDVLSTLEVSPAYQQLIEWLKIVELRFNVPVGQEGFVKTTPFPLGFQRLLSHQAGLVPMESDSVVQLDTGIISAPEAKKLLRKAKKSGVFDPCLLFSLLDCSEFRQRIATSKIVNATVKRSKEQDD